MDNSHSWIGIALVLATCWVYSQAQGKYTDPDSAQVNAAARQALAHAKILDTHARVINIVGVSSGIQGYLRISERRSARQKCAST